MKAPFLLRVPFVLVAALVCADRVFSEEEKPEQHQPEMNPQKMAEAMADYAKVITPGEHHKKLEPFVGQWNIVTKMWMGGPGATPVETKGTSTIKWVLGGRFLHEEMKGHIMGQPHEGIGYTGYDNYKNMYVASWMDNHGTAILSMKGSIDPSGKVLTFYGEMDEPLLDVQDRMVKYVARIINENKNVFEIYDLHAGEDYKVLEVVYTRQ